jgi:acetylornithine/succinyldiaminopimelate/putrescine aminotransferase
MGDYLKTELLRMGAAHPSALTAVRGFGLMIGFELAANIPAFQGNGKAASLQFVNRLHQEGVLTVPSGTQVVRLLPALNLARSEADEGLAAIERCSNRWRNGAR